MTTRFQTSSPRDAQANALPKREKRGPQGLAAADARPNAALLRRVEGGESGSLVQRTVDALRRTVLEAPGPGHFLGSEELLISSLGVSRPTFRQAANLLTHEGLLTIKRGMGGGFFTRAPSGDAVSRNAAIYLNAQGTSMRQIHGVVGLLQAEAARVVARSPDVAHRSRLMQLVTSWDEDPAPSGREVVQRLLAFERLLVECALNPAIELTMNTMLDLIRDARRVETMRTPERLRSYEQYQRRLAKAVQDGDPEMAALICSRYVREVHAWLPDDRLDLKMSAPR